MSSNSHITLRAGAVSQVTGISRLGPASLRWLFVLAMVICCGRASFATVRTSAALPFHLVSGFVVVVPVSINDKGPFDFMLDTGATMTTVDPTLAKELTLQGEGTATATTLVEHMPVSLAIAQRISVGPVSEQKLEVMVRDLKGLRSLAPTIRGVLGQNALNHADFLLDYRHRLLEFDTDGELVHALTGHHIPLKRVPVKENPQDTNLVVGAGLPFDGMPHADLLLDSGTATLVVFSSPMQVNTGYAMGFVSDVAGRRQMAEVREREVSVDGHLRVVPSYRVNFNGGGQNIGGLLPTAIFRSIYVSNSGGFAIFEPKETKPVPGDVTVAGSGTQNIAAHSGSR